MVTLCAQKKVWTQELKQAGVFAPAFELCELIAFGMGLDRAAQLAEPDRPVTPEEAGRMAELLAQRCTGQPLQYILGRWEFYGLEFLVGEGVLIPRADTEALVDAGLRLCRGFSEPRILDLCSGSGCIAVALAKHRSDAQVTAVELSDVAFEYLTQNVARNGASNVRPIRADVLEGPDGVTAGERFHLIVSNPPYIPSGELAGLQREVRREPAMALDGDEDGLLFYREIARRYRDSLVPGGWLAFEVGDDQSGDVQKILMKQGFTEIFAAKDLEGFERVVMGRRPEGGK